MRAIPCVLMRGGTSRGPFLRASDLPTIAGERDEVLLRIMGSGNELEIDGIGGGNPLTSKVAIVDRSSDDDADVDYLFAQVGVETRVVDMGPNCGNMLAAVGPYAIEAGIVAATDPLTLVRIRNVNTGKLIDAFVQTPGGTLSYEGTTAIDGVPGTAAPVRLSFRDAAGAKTGKLLPTGNRLDMIDGVGVTLIDMAVPLVIIGAASLGKTGYETPDELDADRALLERIGAMRLEAGVLMGLGDVAGRVLPKVALVAPPVRGGTISSRYFVPTSTHRTHSITGGVCLATAALIPGTVAHMVAAAVSRRSGGAVTCAIEHPAGRMEVELELDAASEGGVRRASLVRTARKIFSGLVHIL